MALLSPEPGFKAAGYSAHPELVEGWRLSGGNRPPAADHSAHPELVAGWRPAAGGEGGV